MKKYNRVLTLLLAFAMILTVLPSGALAAVAGDDQNTNPYSGSLAEQSAALRENYPQQAGEGRFTENSTGGLTSKEVDSVGVNLKNQVKESEKLDVTPYADDEMVQAIVVLKEDSLLDYGYTTEQIANPSNKVSFLMDTMETNQEAVLCGINEIVRNMASGVSTYGLYQAPVVTPKYNYTVAISGMAIEVPYGALRQIEELDGVDYAFVAPQYEVPEDMTTTGIRDPRTSVTRDTFGTEEAWGLGYTGKGMRLAVIDTGLDLDHPSFVGVPELLETSLYKDEVASVVADLNASTAYYQTNSTTLTADGLYRTGKIPFAFNYADGTLDATHDNDTQGDHGTHVAGIAASNRTDDTLVAGVAPDAQVLVMKVFGINGGGNFADIIAALEDCFKLNVDAVNMSLGTPCGFSRDEEEKTNLIFSKIKESDMMVVVSAGNSGSAADENLFGTDKNLTRDPDISTVGNPATYEGSTMVASVENAYVMFNYLVVGGQDVPFSDVGAMRFTDLAGQPRTYVIVPGYGTAEDFALVDVKDKIAVVSRGAIDFTAKQTNAYNAGAVGCLVYDNVEGELINMMDAGVIRNAATTKAGGELLAANADANGEGTLEVMPRDQHMQSPSPSAGEMSDFSSWGVTPDLLLRPDVTAPGGNIYSTLTNGKYGVMSGTSMAAPHVAGMSALVLQYLFAEHPELTGGDVHTVAESLVMSTAEPFREDSGSFYSPRKQGAGVANVYDALTSAVYLTVNGDTPKVSMGDDPARTGKYTFEFELNNLSDMELTYALDGSVLTDQVNLDYADYGYEFMGETSRDLEAEVAFAVKNGASALKYDADKDGDFDLDDVQYLLDSVNGLHPALPNDPFDLTSDSKQDTADAQALYELLLALPSTDVTVVAVPAGGKVTVSATVELTASDKAYMNRYYENGVYVDGFVQCYALGDENTVNLSLPFMGFYGNWSDAPIFDTGWYYESDEEMEANRYPNFIFTNYGTSSFLMGLNPYIGEERYSPAHNVLSPNGDGYQDRVDEIYLGLMRSLKELRFSWKDENNTYFEETAPFVRKSYFIPDYGFCMPFSYNMYLGEEAYYDFTDANGTYLADGTHLELLIEGALDYKDDVADEALRIPVVIDTVAPELVGWDYNETTHQLKLQVTDNYDIAAVCVLTQTDSVIEMIPVDNYTAGSVVEVVVDITGFDETFKIAICDYGCNETYEEFTFTGDHTVNTGSFYGYRRYAVIPSGNLLYPTNAYNGWHSFRTDSAETMLMHTSQFSSGETAVAAAEYIDGYILGIDVNGGVFAIRNGQWSRNYFANFPYTALDMAFDYSTKTLFVLTDESSDGAGDYRLIQMDHVTGEIVDESNVTGMSSFGLTLACDNEGVLYTIDYATGSLYTLSVAGDASFVGKTGYQPSLVQSMAVDHDTDKLYWTAYQGYDGESIFFEIDKATGDLSAISAVEYNSEMVGLYKPYTPEESIYPDSAEVLSLMLNKTSLSLGLNKVEALACYAVPFYAELDDVTWTSSNENVAVVEDGIVTTIGVGTAVITASANGLSVQCTVEVTAFTGDLRLYTDMTQEWLAFQAEDPAGASVIPNAQPSAGTLSATYYDGFIYAFDFVGGFWKLDPDTLQGYKLGEANAQITALTYNYSDRYLYAIEYVNDFFDSAFYLCRVNPSNGQVQRIQYLDPMEYGSPLGGLATDYEGNFYLAGMNNMTFSTMVMRFNLIEGATEDAVDTSTITMCEVGVYEGEGDPNFTAFGSMVYSGDNNGLFCVDAGGHLWWIDTAKIDNGSMDPVDVGSVAGASDYGFNLGLVSVSESDLPENTIPAISASMPNSILLLEGGTASANVVVEPWNAAVTAIYAMDDPTVASVDEYGNIIGLKEGFTTLRVRVMLETGPAELSATIYVRPSAGTLRGFLGIDMTWNAYDLWVHFSDTDTEDLVLDSLREYDYTVFAGAYYDGYLYAVGQGSKGFQFLKIDPNGYSYEVLNEVNYNVLDMTFDYTTGTMYAIVQGSQTKGSALGMFDLETGELTVLPDNGQSLMTLCCDNLGRLFSVAENGNLYEVNKTTGGIQLVGPTGADVGHVLQSMHYDLNTSNVYWTQVAPDYTGSSLRLVDLNTGSTTSLGAVHGSVTAITAMFTVPEAENIPALPDEVEVTGVKLPAHSTVETGKELALNATILPVSVAYMDRELTWSSSDEDVATVTDGVVTGVAAGTAIITAETTNGKTASCVIEVTEGARTFYAYDESNTQWISFKEDNTIDVTVERVDDADEAKLIASAYDGEALYAYDADNNFYTVDTDSFERTEVCSGDGMMFELPMFSLMDWDYVPVPCDLNSVQFMSYDYATDTLYALVDAYNWAMDDNCQAIVTVDPATGEMTGARGVMIPDPYIEDPEVQITNFLVMDGVVYFVDGHISGMLYSCDLNSETPEIVNHSVISGYWGTATSGRGFIFDPSTDTVYAVRQLDGQGSILHTMNLNDATIDAIGEIGMGITVNGLFIK